VTQPKEFGELLEHSVECVPWLHVQHKGGSELFGPRQRMLAKPKKKKEKIGKGSQSPGAPALGICIKVALLVAAWTAAAAGREQLLKRFLKWLKLHSTWQQEAHS